MLVMLNSTEHEIYSTHKCYYVTCIMMDFVSVLISNQICIQLPNSILKCTLSCCHYKRKNLKIDKKIHFSFSSMVIRDLTLRSAASFGSFHLIRLLYDEYMFYLVEHKVAAATGETPIAVMGEVRRDFIM